MVSGASIAVAATGEAVSGTVDEGRSVPEGLEGAAARKSAERRKKAHPRRRGRMPRQEAWEQVLHRGASATPEGRDRGQ